MWLSAIKLALNAGGKIYANRQKTKMAMSDAQLMHAERQARGEEAYQGKLLEHFPASLKVLAECKPIHETLPGWSENISDIKKLEGFPVNVRNYLDRIAELTQTPIDIISVGADREQTVILKNPFA